MTQLFSAVFYCLAATVYPTEGVALNNCRSVNPVGVYFKVENSGLLLPDADICKITVRGTKRDTWGAPVEAFIPCNSIGKKVR